jgi:hypothetical protein
MKNYPRQHKFYDIKLEASTIKHGRKYLPVANTLAFIDKLAEVPGIARDQM